MRPLVTVAGLLVLAACSPSIPDSASGVGFQNYDEFAAEQEARDAALAGASPIPPAGALSDETTTGAVPLSALDGVSVNQPQSDAEAVAADTTAALAAARANSGVAPLEANPNNPSPQTIANASGISSENDFEAVDSVRSIEGDAAFIAQNKQQYQVIEPTALPQRNSAASGPNIVSYALSTSHPIGTKIYNRIGINKQGRFVRNCAKYASSDRAQQDFLEKGGPQRDRMGLDPDGDGYACAWNPAPFRNAVNG